MSRLKLLEMTPAPNGIILGMMRNDGNYISDEVMLSDGTIREGFIDGSVKYLIMTLNEFYPGFIDSSRFVINEEENVIFIEVRSWEKPNHHKVYDFIEYYNERLIDLRMYIYLERFIEPASPKAPKSRRVSPKSRKTKVKRSN